MAVPCRGGQPDSDVIAAAWPSDCDVEWVPRQRGLAPAWQGARTDLNAALKAASRSTSGGIGRARTRNALVVTQVALSLVLLGGAGLLLKTFVALRGVGPGFDPRDVIRVPGRPIDPA